ncbi:MAG TPA: HTTM domain-containing protein [Pseudolabrys sp.]|nr:HTTM domain-containing protein [Pseudolabrys sp.]
MPTTPLEIVRIGVGAALFINYGLATPYLYFLWGESGWMPSSLLFQDSIDIWAQSVFFYFTAPWQWAAFHGVFLLCCAALVLGWRTFLLKWVVLVGQISYAYRNPYLPYGADQILSALLIILCIAPIGRAISLDRVRAMRAAKRRNIKAKLSAYTSPWTGACTRLMQIQMAVLFFFSGIEKIRGDEWWSGDALWALFANVDYYNHALLDLFASQYWLVNIASYLTILIEVAYPFLIWQRRTRLYLLAAAVFLHVQFAILLGLPYFSFVMIMGHMSFLRPEWLARLGAWWKRRIGAMEMIYDGRCGFCVRSLVWFLSFDGLGQIKVRNFRSNPSPVVSDAKMERALYLVLPDGRALPGFEAYRYVVLRVPGLWWQVPFFYVPVFSRLFGHPIYNWVAANRSRLSAVRFGLPRAPAK